jgi:dCTP deaminase
MILSDATLKQLLDSGELYVSPLAENSIQPASIDCRLGSHFLMVDESKSDIITLDHPIQYKEVESDSIIIPPHHFLLATTLETIKLPANLSAFVEGRSSIGRIGLFIQNAGWVDAGFEGKITLELYNANSLPIRLDAGRRICQLVFCKMDQAATTPYIGKYQGQSKAVGSRIHMDTDPQ